MMGLAAVVAWIWPSEIWEICAVVARVRRARSVREERVLDDGGITMVTQGGN